MDGQAFAATLARDVVAILGPELVGVYLHGSLALGGFDAARSDVDLLVVVRGPLDVRREPLLELFRERSGNPFPLEVSVLRRDGLRPWRHPSPYELHFGESGIAGPGADRDLAVHVTALRARGIVLAGAPIGDVFPEVPAEDFRDAVLADLDWALAHGKHAYRVLNACRIVAWLETGAVLSKSEGAEWAGPRLTAGERRIVAHALAGEPCAPQEAEALVRRVVATALS